MWKKLVIIEQTAPWQSRRDDTYERNKTKYTELMEQCLSHGWHTWLFPIDVDFRGFCLQFVRRLMAAVGTYGRDRD